MAHHNRQKDKKKKRSSESICGLSPKATSAFAFTKRKRLQQRLEAARNAPKSQKPPKLRRKREIYRDSLGAI